MAVSAECETLVSDVTPNRVEERFDAPTQVDVTEYGLLNDDVDTGSLKMIDILSRFSKHAKP